MLMQSYVQSAQQALVVQDQKPTAEELQQYFDARYTADQIIFDLLEKYGECIVNKRDPKNDPIIFSAISDQNNKWTLDKFEQLLRTPGLDFNVNNYFGTIPLDWAVPSTKSVINRSLEKFNLLIQYGADIDQCNYSGFTALIDAALENLPQYVAVLLNAGASTQGHITQGGYAGKTFFDFAKEHPSVQQVYETYRQKLRARLVEVLNVAEMPELIEEYLFTPLPIDQEKIKVALEEYKKN